MRGVRGDTATPGEFRRTQNWIGPAGCTPATATYIPPPADELMECLGEWEAWLDYFLRGVAGQAEDALGRIQQIDELSLGWRVGLASAHTRVPERALDLFIENPFRTVGNMAKRLGVAYTTAQRAIERLESDGIVTLVTEDKRNRVYCAKDVLAIMEEPPRL